MLSLVLLLAAWTQVPTAPTNVAVNAQLALPSILGLSSSSGLVGATVIVHGANFGQIQGVSTVKFNGTTATVTVWTIDTLTTTVPVGATTGNVVVTVAGNASNGSPFTVLVPPPTVTITVPTASPTYDAGTASAIGVSGTASTAGSLTGCTWVNSLGGSGATTGTTNWSISSVTLTVGTNTVTVTCTDAQTQTGNDVIAITRSAGGPATNPIAAVRLPSNSQTLPESVWAAAGAGTIPTRARCTTGTGASQLASSSTAAQINTALSGCDANHQVELGTGTFTLSTGLLMTKDNVSLHGNGPTLTHLTFTGNNSCFGFNSLICISGTDHWDAPFTPNHTATWTATSYTRGQTVLTFSSTTGLSVGEVVMLDQIQDGTDTGQIWTCSQTTTCADEGGGSFARGQGTASARIQEQLVTVTNIAGSVVTITPGLYMPNWRAAQSPGAMWGDDQVDGAGVDGFSMNATAGGGQYGIGFFLAVGGWVKNVESYNTARGHVMFYLSKNLTIRDSYFDEGQAHASQSYGIEAFISSDALVENNIFHHVTSPIMWNGTMSGNVAAYNYTFDNTYTASAGFMVAGMNLHEGGQDSGLFESNDTNSLQGDNIHGSHHFVTYFRNYSNGWETGKNDQTSPVQQAAFSRYLNFVGNVLGRTGYHDTYQFAGEGATAIYSLGLGRGLPPDDPKVASTMLRWGNYDTVTATSRFQSSEVPSADPNYPNAVPGSQTLPSSLYLSAKPAFYGATAWPSIGPDVSGGSVTGVGGHVNVIPARACYENGVKDGNGKLTAFNAATCYP